MLKKLHVVTTIIYLVLLLPYSEVHAGDEDMNPTAYQRFDPITGYMVPIDSSVTQQHETSLNTSAESNKPVNTIVIALGLIGLIVITRLIKKNNKVSDNKLD